MTSVVEFLKPKFGVLSFGDINQKGKARIANIFDARGKPIKLNLCKEPVLRTPWQVSSFDGGERCTLDVVLTPELERVADKIDSDVLVLSRKIQIVILRLLPKRIGIRASRRSRAKKDMRGL